MIRCRRLGEAVRCSFERFEVSVTSTSDEFDLELEFDEFAPELTTFLERYREMEKNKKSAKAKPSETKVEYLTM